MGGVPLVIPVRGVNRLVSGGLGLTERQTMIVEMIAAGYTDKELVSRLGMLAGTLRTHLDRMFRRFGVHSRAALVACWLRRS
jgi:DNA-binding CsgD family transcriptional regulator